MKALKGHMFKTKTSRLAASSSAPINENTSSDAEEVDDVKSRTSAKIIAQISQKYKLGMSGSESDITTTVVRPRTRITRSHTEEHDREYEADISESCMSSPSDVDMASPKAGGSVPDKGSSVPVLPVKSTIPHVKRKQKVKNKFVPPQNNNSWRGKNLSPLATPSNTIQIDHISPIFTPDSLHTQNVKLCSNSHSSSPNSDRDITVESSGNDSVALRRLQCDMNTLFPTKSDTMLVINGRSLRKRRVDVSTPNRDSRDLSSVNQTTWDSGIFMSPNAPSHKKLKTSTIVSTSTPNSSATTDRADCFGFDVPASPVERVDTPMSDYPSSIGTPNVLSSMDMSYNIASNLNNMEFENVKLFPTMTQPSRKKRKPPKKKIEEITEEVNAEFSEIENFQLTIE